MKNEIHKLKHDDHVYHRGLPKASWINVDLRGLSLSRPWFAKMRFANAVSYFLFGASVVVRRPWLAGPARQLHPELFKDVGGKGGMSEQEWGTLHIFGQQIWHGSAHIIGDRKGLELLRDLIETALKDGVATSSGCHFFQDDGEGFSLNVAVCNEAELRTLSSAYHDCDLFPDYDGVSPEEVVEAKIKALEVKP